MGRWLTAAVAFWLFFAPLVFWSPTPATYLMDTLIGSLLITFAILVPGVPGRGDGESWAGAETILRAGLITRRHGYGGGLGLPWHL